ncbi:MAG: HK97 family phage prohead protease [Rhodobacteraceae bacterium]|nr:HK97 family phage prohead protease [Paracoccaceae bacterium]
MNWHHPPPPPVAASGLETKFARFGPDLRAGEDELIEGYASVFSAPDAAGDTVQPGAYRAALERMSREGRRVKMLWQHDPAQPIGVWDSVTEDSRGLLVRGRLLPEVQRGAECLALVRAGAIDGLSIGYRTLRAEADGAGRRLWELDLWEVSLVTFPLAPQARLSVSPPPGETTEDLLAALTEALRADEA